MLCRALHAMNMQAGKLILDCEEGLPMSILRRGIIMSNSGAGKDSADGISVKCPKCQAVIMVTGMRGEAPV